MQGALRQHGATYVSAPDEATTRSLHVPANPWAPGCGTAWPRSPLSGELFVVSDTELHHSFRPPRSLDQGRLSMTEREQQRLRDEAAQDDAVSSCGEGSLSSRQRISAYADGGLCKQSFGRQHCVQVGPTGTPSSSEGSSD